MVTYSVEFEKRPREPAVIVIQPKSDAPAVIDLDVQLANAKIENQVAHSSPVG
jgi:hypothetical protein